MLKRKVDSALRIAREQGWAGLRDAVQRNIFDKQQAQIDEVAIVRAAFRDADIKGVMIDVGAHSGDTSEPFCNDGWRVVAFEPDAINRTRLIERLKPFSNATIDIRAVSNEEKEAVTFYRGSASTGISGLSAFDPSHIASDTVPMTTLTRALQDHGVGAVDFLKIDTEGFDKFVLEGAPWDLIQPTVIVCEFENKKTVPLGYTFSDLADFLISKGYRVTVSEWQPVIRYGIEHHWNRFMSYPNDLSTPLAWGNLIAVRGDHLQRLVSHHCAAAEQSYRRQHPVK